MKYSSCIRHNKPVTTREHEEQESKALRAQKKSFIFRFIQCYTDIHIHPSIDGKNWQKKIISHGKVRKTQPVLSKNSMMAIFFFIYKINILGNTIV